MSELYHLKALSAFLPNQGAFQIKKKLNIRYDKIKSMNLTDLLKKVKELEIS
jgi:hypothetical protein